MNVACKTFLSLTHAYLILILYIERAHVCARAKLFYTFYLLTHLVDSVSSSFFIARNAKCNSHCYAVSSADKIVRYKYLHRYAECFYRHRDYFGRRE